MLRIKNSNRFYYHLIVLLFLSACENSHDVSDASVKRVSAQDEVQTESVKQELNALTISCIYQYKYPAQINLEGYDSVPLVEIGELSFKYSEGSSFQIGMPTNQGTIQIDEEVLFSNLVEGIDFESLSPEEQNQLISHLHQTKNQISNALFSQYQSIPKQIASRLSPFDAEFKVVHSPTETQILDMKSSNGFNIRLYLGANGIVYLDHINDIKFPEIPGIEMDQFRLTGICRSIDTISFSTLINNSKKISCGNLDKTDSFTLTNFSNLEPNQSGHLQPSMDVISEENITFHTKANVETTGSAKELKFSQTSNGNSKSFAIDLDSGLAKRTVSSENHQITNVDIYFCQYYQ